MKRKFTESELILRPDGSVYHLGIKGEDIADDVIIVGDPERVGLISEKFDSIRIKRSSREFCIHTGSLRNKEITVISTGIGVDNIDIVINELDAAVNINPETRTENEVLRSLNFLRLGTSGAMRPEIKLHDIVCSEAAIGMDGVPHFYAIDWLDEEKELVQSFSKFTSWPSELATPYAVLASNKMVSQFSEVYDHKGMTITANGFYGPQNRELRGRLKIKLYENYNEFKWKGLVINNFEMETSGIYALSKMLGHSHLTLCVILANRSKKIFSSDPSEAVNSLINKSLESLTN